MRTALNWLVVLALALIVVTVQGCGGMMAMQPDFSAMTKDQINALIKDRKTGETVCVPAGPWGKAVITSADQSTGRAAGNGRVIEVDGNTCTTKITETPAPPLPHAMKPTGVVLP